MTIDDGKAETVFDLLEETCTPERNVCTARYRTDAKALTGLFAGDPTKVASEVSLALIANGELLEKTYPVRFLVLRRPGSAEEREKVAAAGLAE
jgi:hypothetical protein